MYPFGVKAPPRGCLFDTAGAAVGEINSICDGGSGMEMDRRKFGVLGGAVLATTTALTSSSVHAQRAAAEPWYRRVRRWGQINITEDDGNMDVGFWRQYMKDTFTQGTIINSGGVVNYYDSKIPGAHKALTLGNRDLLGELANACREDGVVYVARMTNNPTDEVIKMHPEWMCQDVNGKHTNQACMNGGFLYEWIPAQMREIIARYRPAGFAVNGGGGLNYKLCYCQVCTKRFKEATGHDLPKTVNWQDPVYREWVNWNADQVIALWDFQNKVTRSAGGPDCYWIGMTRGVVTERNMLRILERSPVSFQDHQNRSDASGFQQFTEDGKLTHGIMGWDKIVTASQALYGPRMTTKAAPESQMWMYDGIAGSISPWWHTISAHHHDKRRYQTALPVFKWHEQNEQYLYKRTPVATVGIVYSEDNNVFYGRNDVNGNVEMPWRGWINTFTRYRIPYIVINADNIERDKSKVSTLVLPNLAAMTDAQVAAVKRFVADGCSLIATGDTSLHDRFGDPRQDFALADLFGAHWIPGTQPNTGYRSSMNGRGNSFEVDFSLGYHAAGESERPLGINTYARLTPELRANVAYSPHPKGDEPPVAPGAVRNPILKGFDETDVIYFGGVVPKLNTDANVEVLLTFIPVAPVLQAENAWWRTPKTDIPALMTRTLPNGARVVFMPADFDREYAASGNPDHGILLSNTVRWAAKDDLPLAVDGPGYMDCNLYQQSGRMVLHVANLTYTTFRAPLDEFVPVGPFKVRVKLSKDVLGQSVKLLVSGQAAQASVSNGWVEFVIPSVASHEVVAIS
jgi:hypothetical protein